ncbi:AAA family ATPase [Halorubrum distributum]|uniref:AAA family ATPase n=1 Tax=Halorubrum distributum TaxID=29283 RepID=UPI00399D2BB2
MEFHAIEVSGYRSLDSDVELSFEPNITTLVGPNESGKSNLISAIEKCKLSPEYNDSDESYLSDHRPCVVIELRKISSKKYLIV